MRNFKTIALLSLTLSACQGENKEAEAEEEFEDCPAIVLDCPEGQVACDIETDNDPCVEVVLGEEPCTQTRYCMPE